MVVIHVLLLINPGQMFPLVSIDQMRAEFGLLLNSIRRILNASPDREDNLESCKELCLFLKAGDDTSAPLLSFEKMKEIECCTDFRELFTILRQHISWDEHTVLCEIIDICGSDEAEHEYNQYKRKIAVIKALEIISSVEEEPPPGFEKFCVVISKPYKKFTIEQYEKMKAFIFDNLNVHRYVSNGYIRVLFDSLHLEWHVTTQAIPHMIKIVRERREFFEENHFVFMQLGVEIVINKYTEQTLVS